VSTLVIPDLHHRTAAADRILAAEAQSPHRVVFLGDYLDDFGDNPDIARGTAEWMRRQIEAGHTLLWGNHDLPYGFRPDLHRCPGYEPRKAAEVNKVLTRPLWKKLKLWHLVNVPGDRPWVLSHAGFHPGWFDLAGGPGRANPLAHLEWLHKEALEMLYEAGETHPVINACPQSRGGRDPIGGVLWMDWGDFRPLRGLNQLVGHTPLRNPDAFEAEESTNWCIDTNTQHYVVIEDSGEISIRRTPPRAG